MISLIKKQFNTGFNWLDIAIPRKCQSFTLRSGVLISSGIHDVAIEPLEVATNLITRLINVHEG
jgi:hypothetical protein